MAKRFYPLLQWASWLLAEARWQRDQALAEVETLRGATPDRREQVKALLNIAACEARKRLHHGRADRFARAFVDHKDGVCPATGECVAERDAWAALREYGVIAEVQR